MFSFTRIAKGKPHDFQFINRLLQKTNSYIKKQTLFPRKITPKINKNSKRALLCYLPAAFEYTNDQLNNCHQNLCCNVAIAEILEDLGFNVEVIRWDDYKTIVNTNRYDLLIGFGRADELALQMPNKVLKIRLATGSEAHFSNGRELQRIEIIAEKKQCNLKLVRQIYENSELLKYYDGIACIGNKTIGNTYLPYFDKKILHWNNYGFDKYMGIPREKFLDKCGNNFLFISGSGFALAGLDILLETFTDIKELNLFVCGNFDAEPDFVKCYQKELFGSENIYPIGWVNQNGNMYQWLMKKCCSVIFPCFSAGQPGSVINTMAYGLIPIVSSCAGIDTAKFGYTLSQINKTKISKIVRLIGSKPIDWVEKKSRAVYSSYKKKFSQDSFKNRFKNILIEFINDHENNLSIN